MAVQRRSGMAAIRPATTLVLPTLRECPPITTMAMLHIQSIHLRIAEFKNWRIAVYSAK
jgi:hypothetical protein